MTDAAPQLTAPSGDQPVDDMTQDRLGRGGFVALLAEEITGAPRSGFVIGVTGQWGSGKTSVINMAVNPLAEKKGYRVLRFNPWLFSGTPQLIEHFFTELAAQLREAGSRRKGERLGDLGDAIEGYGELLDPLRFAPGVDKVLQASKAASGVLRRAGKRPDSAHTRKEALDKLLGDHEEVLVVVIDDIDRLEPSETRDVMRLVRLVGDFPNVVYVLAYSTEVVSRALGGPGLDLDQTKAEGHAYLEKIVQVTHPIPAIDRDAMSRLVLERLGEALEGVAYEVEAQHWSDVYSAIRNYFTTMRDVLRYCNAVRAPVQHLVSEIAVADILGLEALRLFEPGVWEGLPSLDTALTSARESYMSDSDRVADEARIKGLMEAAGDHRAVEHLIPALFPAVRRLFGNSIFGSEWQGDWRRSGRVAHIDVLRVYLSRQVASDRASRGEARAVVDTLTDPPALSRLLASVDDERLPSLLSRVEDYEEELGPQAVLALPILYQLVPRLSPRGHGLFDLDPEMRISRVVYRILKDQPGDVITEALGPVLPDLDLLSSRVSVLRTLGWRAERAETMVDDETLGRWAQDVAAEALRQSPEQLAQEHSLGLIVTLVKEFYPDSAREWLAARIAYQPFLLRLLTTYMREIRNSAGRVTQLLWDALIELLGENDLIAAVRELPDNESRLDKITDDEREMVKQARIFANDPAEARRVMAEQRQRYG